MYRIYVKGSYFYLEKNGILLIETGRLNVEIKKYTTTAVRFRVIVLEEPNSFTDIIPFSNIRKQDGTAYSSQEDFETWYTDNTGNFKQGGRSGEGVASFSGWIDYNHSGSSVLLPANTWVDLPNDGAGAFSNRSPTPLAGGVTELMDLSTGRLVFDSLKVGDSVYLRHDFSVNPDTNNATLEFRYFIGEAGKEYPQNVSIPRLDRGSGIDYSETGLSFLYMGNDSTRLGGARLQARLSTTGTLNNNGVAINYSIY